MSEQEKPTEQINLLRGWPSRALLPVDLIKEAANVVLSDPSVYNDGLLYGPDEGYQPCREAVAKWLEKFYHPTHGIEADRICITGGASQNLGLALNVFTDPEYTRNAWLVAPAYMMVFRIIQDAGFEGKMRAVPEDDEGIDIEYFRRELQKVEEDAQREANTKPRFKSNRTRGKVYKHVLYVVPSFSNPSSRTMSLRRRQELLRLAREFDMLIVCDDVYDMLQWPAESTTPESIKDLDVLETTHLPRLVDIDRELDGGTEREGADGFGNVLSNGTFSKMAGPGLRTGWAEGTAKLAYGLAQAGVTKSGGSPCQFTSTYVTQLLITGQLQDHIRNVLRPAYASRYKALMSAIETHLLPLGFTLPQADRDIIGGYFLWLSLPDAMQATDLTAKCLEDQNLIIMPGHLFQVPGDDAVVCPHNIRLCFAWEDENNFFEGVGRIAEAAKTLLKKDGRESEEFVIVERKDGGEADVLS